jgi:hypothetical protein
LAKAVSRISLNRSLRRKRHLEASGGEHRPSIVISKQPICGLLHKHEIARLCAYAPQNSEDRLHEERRLYEFPVDEMGEV